MAESSIIDPKTDRPYEARAGAFVSKLRRLDDYELNLWGLGYSLDNTSDTAGIKMNREVALTYSPWWRGINLIAGDIAKLPTFVNARNGDGKRRATEHPAYNLLRWKPNRYMTASTFKHTVEYHRLSEGNGYVYVARRGDGTPDELLPLNPDVTYPVRANGVLWYVTHVGADMRQLPASDVIHLKGMGFDGLVGYPVWHFARRMLARGIACETYATKFFKNNARPDIVLEHPGTLSKEGVERLVESWRNAGQGLDGAHKTKVLEEGMKANSLAGSSAKDSQMNETEQQLIKMCSNWLGVPASKLGDTSQLGYRSLEESNLDYLTGALDSRLVTWEEECRDKLLSEAEKAGDTHTIDFERKALLRASMQVRGEFFAKATGNKPWMTQNEVRGIEDMNPSDDPDADKLTTPANLMGTPAKSGPDENPPTSDDESQRSDEPDANNTQTLPPARETPEQSAMKRRLLGDVYGRMVRRLCIQARKAAKSEDTFAKWHRAAADDNLPTVVATIGPAVGICCGVYGAGGDAVTANAASMLISEAMERIGLNPDNVESAAALVESELPMRLAEITLGVD